MGAKNDIITYWKRKKEAVNHSELRKAHVGLGSAGNSEFLLSRSADECSPLVCLMPVVAGFR